MRKPMMGAEQMPDEEEDMPMAGMEQEDAPTEGGATTSEDMPEGQGGDEGEPATPEEQEQYERFVANAMALVYSDKNNYGTLRKVIERLKVGEDPIEGLASVTTHIFMALVTSATKKGVQISTDVMMQGGYDIVSDLAELAGLAKIHKYTQEEIEGAYYRAADMVREQMQSMGLLDAQEQASQLEMLKQAEQEGKLDQVLPGATEAAKKLGKAAPTPESEEDDEEAAEPEEEDAPPSDDDEAAPPPEEDEEEDKPKGMRPKGK